MYSSRMRTARSSSRLLEGVSASVHAGIPPGLGLDPPQVWALIPPVWAWTIPPLVWAWTPPGQTPQPPLGSGPRPHPQPSSWAWA